MRIRRIGWVMGLSLSMALLNVCILVGAQAPTTVRVPQGQTLPSTPSEAKKPVTLPKDVPLQPDQAVIQYLLERDYFNPFPDNLFRPDMPISRAEFVTLLYRASGMNTPFLSEFAYFRDVPKDHWAYLPIEGFRMRNIIGGVTDGFFEPEEPITRLSAGAILSRTLSESWLRLSSQEISDTLMAYDQSVDSVPGWARYDLARSVYAGFLLPVSKQVSPQQARFSLELDAPLTRMDAVRMVYRRALIGIEEEMRAVERVPWIPVGVQMTVSPTSAISQAQLFVGQTLYFATVDTVEVPQANLTLPRGTRIHGHVVALSSDRSQATVTLDRALLPSGTYYNMVSQLLVQFKPEEEEQRFVVPGQNFQIETLPQP